MDGYLCRAPSNKVARNVHAGLNEQAGVCVQRFWRRCAVCLALVCNVLGAGVQLHGVLQHILKGKLKVEDLTEDQVMPNVRQKGVDMRIGIDVASLAFKKQVDQIVLIAGDADFVPAAKQARREGIDFILDPLRADIPAGLQEHIDGLRSTCPRLPPRGQEG